MTNDLKWMKWEGEAFIKDTIGMKAANKYHYHLLCWRIFQADDGWLKDDDNWIAAALGITPTIWRKAREEIGPYLELMTDDNGDKWLSQKRAKQEGEFALKKIKQTKSAGKESVKQRARDKKKMTRRKGKRNENNTTPSTDASTDVVTDVPTDVIADVSTITLHNNVIPIGRDNSARENEELGKWVLEITGLDQNAMPVNPSMIRTWERNYSVAAIREAIEKVVAQKSYKTAKVKGLGYFTEAIAELDEKMKGNIEARIDAAVRGLSHDDWAFMIDRWVAGGDWPASVYGPAPDEQDNFVLPDLAKEFATVIAARNNPKKAAANGSDDGIDFDTET